MDINDFGQIASDATLLSRIAPILVKSIQLTFIKVDLFFKYLIYFNYLKNRFCVIHELLPLVNSTRFRFRRFWGYMVLCSPTYCDTVRAQLHHSSPHFQTDG